MRKFITLIVSFIALGSSARADTTWHVASPMAPSSGYSIVMADSDPMGGFQSLSLGDTLSYSLTGATNLRVEAIPILDRGTESSFFRYTIGYTGSANAAHKRKAKRADAASSVRDAHGKEIAIPDGQVLGAKNVLSRALPPGSRTIRIWLRSAPVKQVYLRVSGGRRAESASEIARSPGIRSEPTNVRFSSDAQIGQAGYDSNPYRASNGSPAPDGALFWPVSADLTVRVRDWHSMQLKASYDFDAQLYGDQDLHEMRHYARFQQSFHPSIGDLSERVRWSFEERLKLRSTTYVGRGETEEFDYFSSSGTTVSLGDRFNYLEGRIRSTLEYEFEAPAKVGLQGSYRARNYHEDYSAYSDIYALDFDEWEFGVEGEWRASKRVRFDLALDQRNRGYSEKFARTANGTELPGTASTERRRAIEAGMKFALSRRTELRLSTELFSNTDLHEGYWNYAGSAFDAGVLREWRGGHELGLKLRYKSWDYENARVGFSSTNPLREKGIFEFGVDGRYRVNSWADFVAEAVFDSHDNNSPEFAYDRWMMTTGFSVRR